LCNSSHYNVGEKIDRLTHSLPKNTVYVHRFPHSRTRTIFIFNSLDSKCNYSATSNNTKLVHWPLMGGLLHLVQYSEEGPGRTAAPPRPLLAVLNVTAHPSTASVPITVLLYDGPLLCGFNVAIRGLMSPIVLN